MMRSQAKGWEARVHVLQAAFAKGIKGGQRSLGSLGKRGIRSKTETYSLSQGTHPTAKNNWRCFHIWLLGGTNHQEPHKELLSQEGSQSSAAPGTPPPRSPQQSPTALSLATDAVGLHLDGGQGGFSHFWEHCSQIKHISTEAWRKQCQQHKAFFTTWVFLLLFSSAIFLLNYTRATLSSNCFIADSLSGKIW